ncbi:MAG TPA: TolC family protein [Thermoanaerobaculia bacterium]
MIRRFALFLLLLVPVAASAQPAPENVPMSLEEATRRALDKNFDIMMERETLLQAEEATKGTRGVYDPFLAADLLYRQYTDPVNSSFSGAPEGGLAPEQKGFSLGANLQQYLPTGGLVAVGGSASREETDSVFTPLSPAYFTALGVDFRQPFLRDFKSDPNRRAIRVADARLEGERARLTSTVANTVAIVEARYWTLLAFRRGVEVLESSVSLADRQLEETKVRVDAGVLARTDIAQPTAELERRRGDLARAKEEVLRSENALKTAILLDPHDPLWNQRLVPSDTAPAPRGPADLARAVEEGLARRPELAEARAGVEVALADLELAESEVLPRLDLIAGYASRGMAGRLNPGFDSPFGPFAIPPPLDGGLGQSWDTLVDQEFPDARIGVSFSLPLGNRQASAALATARSLERQARLSETELQQRIVAEVQNAYGALETARQRLAATRSAREAAETQLFAEQERFGVGLSTNFFVLTRQNDLTSARVDEIQAILDFTRAETEFARATGTLLDLRKVDVMPMAAEPAAKP